MIGSVRRRELALIAGLVAMPTAACGDESDVPAADGTIAAPSTGESSLPAGGSCSVPDGVAADGSVEGRRSEALVELLTGIDEEAVRAEDEGSVIEFDDPNFGGVWGDRAGGLIVAVVDCASVDLERIAQLAGGSDAVRVIEVAHSFETINDFRDRLRDEVQSAGLLADVYIDSTLDGRLIRVVIEDPSLVPDGFGAAIPPDVFVVEAGPIAVPVDG